MMVRRIHIAVAMLMAYLMFPGSAQLTENLLHLALEGHGAHALSDAEHQEACDEDACSGGFHACQCHRNLVFLNAGAEPHVPCGLDEPTEFVVDVEALAEQGVVHTIQRPPRA